MACAADPAVGLLLAKSVAVTDSRAPDRGVWKRLFGQC
ncbi:MAG: hypothetical protein QOJ93_1036, partial [Actinomycetota bacterium]|nr:hypothetical protein [Actinomycetota bacterium]